MTGTSVHRVGPDEEPGVAELISMWVDPSWRGRGAGDGLARLQLWVAAGNDAAERLYARHQFVRTGRVQAMHPDEPARQEFEMVRVVGP